MRETSWKNLCHSEKIYGKRGKSQSTIFRFYFSKIFLATHHGTGSVLIRVDSACLTAGSHHRLWSNFIALALRVLAKEPVLRLVF